MNGLESKNLFHNVIITPHWALGIRNYAIFGQLKAALGLHFAVLGRYLWLPSDSIMQPLGQHNLSLGQHNFDASGMGVLGKAVDWVRNVNAES